MPEEVGTVHTNGTARNGTHAEPGLVMLARKMEATRPVARAEQPARRTRVSGEDAEEAAKRLAETWLDLLVRVRRDDASQKADTLDMILPGMRELLRQRHSEDTLDLELHDPARDRRQFFWEFCNGLPEPGKPSKLAVKRRRLQGRRKELGEVIAANILYETAPDEARARDLAAWARILQRTHANLLGTEAGDELLAVRTESQGKRALVDLARAREELAALDAQQAEPKVSAARGKELHIPRWPTLAEEAYQGLAGKIVRRLEPGTEADPVAMLLQLLVCFGNIIGRSAYWRVNADVHYCNLYGLVIGPTASGRKGLAWGMIKELFRPIDPEWAKEHVSPGLTTAEGLIEMVTDPVFEMQPQFDPAGQRIGDQQVQVKAGVRDKRLLAIETEFASVLKRMEQRGNTLAMALRQAWEGADLRTNSKMNKSRATAAHVSLICHISPEELVRYLVTTEVAGGTGNRFLPVLSRRTKELPLGGELAFLGDFTGPVSAAIEFAKAPPMALFDGEGCFKFSAEGREVRFDEEACALWFKAYHDLTAEKAGLAGKMIARAAAQVRRVATIYALLDCSHVCAARHLRAALAIQDYVTASVQYVFGGALGNPLADEVRALLATRSEGMSRNEIRDAFCRNNSSRDLGQALGQLLDAGRIRTETNRPDGAGRPTEMYYAVAQ